MLKKFSSRSVLLIHTYTLTKTAMLSEVHLVLLTHRHPLTLELCSLDKFTQTYSLTTPWGDKDSHRMSPRCTHTQVRFAFYSASFVQLVCSLIVEIFSPWKINRKVATTCLLVCGSAETIGVVPWRHVSVFVKTGFTQKAGKLRIKVKEWMLFFQTWVFQHVHQGYSGIWWSCSNRWKLIRSNAELGNNIRFG